MIKLRAIIKLRVMIKLPITLGAGVLLATPVLAQDKRDHGVLRETPLVTSGQGIERAVALCDQHIVQDPIFAHYAWPECYTIIDAYRPTAKRLQEQGVAEKAAQDETDHAFVQGIAKTLKCTPATCGDVPPPVGTYSTTSGNITGTSSARLELGTASPPVSPFVPHGDKRNADDLRRAYDYCEQYLQPRMCDGRDCWTPPNENGQTIYTDKNCYEIRHIWLSSDWKNQDEARDKKAKADEIKRAKAFVAGVMRQKP